VILITGGSGFVGRQVVKSLAREGHWLRLVLRSGSSARPESGEKIEVMETPDLFSADPDWLGAALKDIDTVVHLAWYTEPGKYLQSEQNLACLAGTIDLARACCRAGVRRFVGVGTCFEYDLDAGMLTTETPLKPRTLYAACKVAAFQILGQLFAARAIEYAWCRLFYLYGEGEDSRRLVPYVRKKLSAGEPAELSSGNQIRDFMPVHEAGAMIARTVLGTRIGPINVCSGVPVTVRQLAERIADEYGNRELLHFGARPENLVDPPCVVGVRDGGEPWP
jgi:nucleoside-diphosphate-sugar epimerase